MTKARGIVYGTRQLLQWFTASNGKLAVAGLALLLVPEILKHGSNWLFETFPIPKDLPVDQATRIQVVLSWWSLVFLNGCGFIAFLTGCVLLFTAGRRARRDRRRRNPVKPPAPNPDAATEPNRPPAR